LNFLPHLSHSKITGGLRRALFAQAFVQHTSTRPAFLRSAAAKGLRSKSRLHPAHLSVTFGAGFSFHAAFAAHDLEQ
jgi:hypothetical protein